MEPVRLPEPSSVTPLAQVYASRNAGIVTLLLGVALQADYFFGVPFRLGVGVVLIVVGGFAILQAA